MKHLLNYVKTKLTTFKKLWGTSGQFQEDVPENTEALRIRTLWEPCGIISFCFCFCVFLLNPLRHQAA